MSDYLDKKRTFQGVADPYKKVTTKFIKEQDVIYNPITQVYNNQQTEQQVKRFEQQNMIDVLASNRDRALRYEQTYNVLNFDSKLKGLEHRDNFPKDKPWYFRPGKDTLVDYNIISNYSMQEHHFAAPEKRPPPDAIVSVTFGSSVLEKRKEVCQQSPSSRVQRCDEQIPADERPQSKD